MSTLPFVSCICPTYNRAPGYLHLVEEVIESFLRQDYAGPMCLIVHNDCPGQELRVEGGFQTPDGSWQINLPGERRFVRICNPSPGYGRYASLGEKYNASIGYALGDLICPWEDDDISLPWRISQGVRKLGLERGPNNECLYDNWLYDNETQHWVITEYWKPPQVWFLDQRGLHWIHNVGVRHHAGIFTHAAWERAGCYPHVSGTQDSILDQKLGGHLLPSFPQGIPPEEWAYVYRWSVSPVHLSGTAPHDDFYRRVGEMPVEQGTFTLRPHWRTDYAALTREALARR